MTIEVRYSCIQCGLSKVKLEVPTRGAEDVVTWMHATMWLVGGDHRQRSPECRSQHLDLMIPTTGRGDRVGGPVQH